MITFDIDDSRVQARFQAMPEKVRAALMRKVTVLTLMLEARAKGNAPVGPNTKTHTGGQLRRSIFSTTESTPISVTGKVATGADTPYAKYVELGTDPHDILPTKAKALHFLAGGKDVFAKIVHHPGTKAQYFMRDALRDLTPAIKAGLTQAVIEGSQ